jgi:hypothetical protein
MLTETTTRTEFLAELRKHNARNPSNVAVARHLRLVEAMTDAEWIAHRATMLANRPQRGAEAKRLVADVLKRRKMDRI